MLMCVAQALMQIRRWSITAQVVFRGEKKFSQCLIELLSSAMRTIGIYLYRQKGRQGWSYLQKCPS